MRVQFTPPLKFDILTISRYGYHIRIQRRK
jgi:hypothetical protein